MADTLELPSLYVEGDDDLHTIIHLLLRHGIRLDKDLGPVLVKQAQGDEGVLNAMGTAPRVSTNLSIGFVIDADVPVPDRWAAVCARLAGVGIELPNEAPSSGFIGYSEKFKSRAGVWIMPDNAMNAGQLEDLIKTLVPQGDYLMPHAKAATAKASNLGARFPSVDLLKAELHCWLAWQEEPGLPYGTALKARFFRHDSEVAVRFVAWFRELFRLP